MADYKEVEDQNQMRKFGLYGVLFLLLSIGFGVLTVQLATDKVNNANANITYEGEKSVKSASAKRAIIDVTDPNTEIIIKNDNRSLTISTVSSDEELARSPVEPDSLENLSVPPKSAIRISYSSDEADENQWLSEYQFQVWALGNNDVAIHRNGITTVTEYPIKMSLSQLSFKVETETGDKQILYYPDSVWSYLENLRIISNNAQTEPIKLVKDNDQMIYMVKGTSNQRVFALIPSTVCKDIVVSAHTREIISIESCTPVDRIVDLISLTI